MRTIKLLQWLHRSGAAQNDTRPTTYRLTIISLSTMLNTIRKQLYHELQALDVPISRVHVSCADVEHLASTSVTLECPPHLRPRLNALALRLGQSPDIRRIHVESAAGSTLAALPA
ncbi:hypothetical protein CAP48_19505 (plasmid) [Advenella sp. S44]|uniref:hypothetical protein n=1 Tax=Advenella sp. S44 TaxID=1982755 RepID=UPI000C29936A|nr:hypothetical protein [Advenella sp. S44]PJX19991.1 hypothetical protein CAP48_19505 [Advenella sp. S44]